MPRAGHLLIVETSRETDEETGPGLVLSYRERGSKRGGTIHLTEKAARALARTLEGTCKAKDDETAVMHITGKVLNVVSDE